MLFLPKITAAIKNEDTTLYLPLIRKDATPPIIDFFTANVAVTDPGQAIDLQWQTTHAISATLYHMMPTGQFGTYWNVPPDGNIAYNIPASTRNFERFMLYANNDTGDYTSATVTVILNCPYPWFFAPAPNICAQDAAPDTAGAEQQFEQGIMIWVESEDRIFVLFDDAVFSPKWDVFSDEWSDGQPINDPSLTPPTGLYQPERGFGLIWREVQGIRDRLGWAVAPEGGFVTAVQRTSYPKYNEIYIRAHDGNIWYLHAERSDWEKFTPD
jgi:hypothetical protein